MNLRYNSQEKYSNPFNFHYVRPITTVEEYREAAYWPAS
jgi:hypothetical protein